MPAKTAKFSLNPGVIVLSDDGKEVEPGSDIMGKIGTSGLVPEGYFKDEDTDSVINAISSVTNTGKVGDGEIFVYDLEKAVRIRTGETGEEAL